MKGVSAGVSKESWLSLGSPDMNGVDGLEAKRGRYNKCESGGWEKREKGLYTALSDVRLLITPCRTICSVLTG